MNSLEIKVGDKVVWTSIMSYGHVTKRKYRVEKIYLCEKGWGRGTAPHTRAICLDVNTGRRCSLNIAYLKKYYGNTL